MAVILAVVVLAGCAKKRRGKGPQACTRLDMRILFTKRWSLWLKRLRKSGGRLRIDIYPGEQLGTERVHRAIANRRIRHDKTLSSPLESLSQDMVLGLPYLFRDLSTTGKSSPPGRKRDALRCR
jgi:TRAP-type C4-dicarboxylate transport system substrate-binding protein